MSMQADDAPRVRASLHSWLKNAAPKNQGDDLAYHLADLYSAFLSTARQIEHLSSNPPTASDADLRPLLSGLMGELFEHIPQHLEGAKKILEPWAEQLYEEADTRNEL